MSLRERNDCTDEALVPKASAIQSSVLPASTHSLICLICGFRAMRFLESVILPITPHLPPPESVSPYGLNKANYELLTVPVIILPLKRSLQASSSVVSVTVSYL